MFQPTKLNVYKNDSESWDYTQPTLGKSCSGPMVHLFTTFTMLYWIGSTNLESIRHRSYKVWYTHVTTFPTIRWNGKVYTVLCSHEQFFIQAIVPRGFNIIPKHIYFRKSFAFYKRANFKYS